MSESGEPRDCPSCGAPSTRGVSRPRVVSDYEAYECPATGRMIEGRVAHTENLKRTGCRVLETGETQELSRRKAEIERKFDREIEETVEQIYEELPSEKKETLANEVASGINATVTRS